MMRLCGSDTENDETLTSTRGRPAPASTSTAAVQLDDIIDDDSDFEVSSKQRVGAQVSTSRDKSKYVLLLPLLCFVTTSVWTISVFLGEGVD